jgi:tRNA(fMet)-specific endonuclease VapC
MADGWGDDRQARAERVLSSYLWFPLDMEVVNACARLRAESIAAGKALGDNDLWIAATAVSRGYALVTCDLGFCSVQSLDLIYLPAAVDAPAKCP